MPINDRMEEQYTSQLSDDDRLTASEAALKYFKQYAKERPEVVAMWIFGIGFALGWKLKPW